MQNPNVVVDLEIGDGDEVGSTPVACYDQSVPL